MTSIGSFLRRADLNNCGGASPKAKRSLSVEWDSPKGWKERPWLQMDDLGSQAWSYGPGRIPHSLEGGVLSERVISGSRRFGHNIDGHDSRSADVVFATYVASPSIRLQWDGGLAREC